MKKGWQTKKLGEVCSLLNRGISPAYLEEGGVRVLNQKCVRDHEVSYEPSRRHDSKAKKVAAERFIQLGDVLVNSTGTGTLGRVAQVREEPEEATTVDSHVTIARPMPGLFHLDFFGYMLVVIEDAIKEAGEGCGGQTELARSVLAERFSVSYPESLAEQQRIVGLLDEAFEGLATAKANAEKNLQNARALFESHLQSVFTQRGPGWVEKNLGDLCQIKTGKKDVNEGNPDGKYPFFTCAAAHTFSDNYSFDTEALLVAGNGNVGQVSYYSGKFEAYQRTYVLFDFKGVTAKYLFRVLDKRLSATVSKQKLGNTMPYIKIGMLTDFVVPVPPPKEQELVAESLGAIAEETRRLARLYERKHAALEALKQSLLHQAFTGAL